MRLAPQGTRTKHEEARVNEEEEKEGVGRRDQAGGQSRRVGLNWRLWEGEGDAEGVSQPRREKEARVNEEEVGGGAQQAQVRDVFLDARQTVHQH